jgi:hypothetical protein
MVYRYDENMKNTKSLSPRCAARSRRSRALISLTGQHAVVESGLPNLGSCADVRLRSCRSWCGKACEKTLAHVVEGLDSIHAHPKPVRNNSRSSRRNSPPSICFFPFRGRRRKTIATNGCRLSLLPSRLPCPGRLLVISGTE